MYPTDITILNTNKLILLLHHKALIRAFNTNYLFHIANLHVQPAIKLYFSCEITDKGKHMFCIM